MFGGLGEAWPDTFFIIAIDGITQVRAADANLTLPNKGH